MDQIEADALLLIGRIWRAHGVRGEFKVTPETDDPARFEDLTRVYTGKSPDLVESREIQSVRYQPTKRGTLVVLKFKGIDSREEAERLRSKFVYARADDLPPLEEDEFFVHDLVGLRVVTEDGDDVGTIDDVLELPAHEVLVIRRPGKASAMVPAVSEFVVDIDLDGSRIVIRPIEGLLE